MSAEVSYMPQRLSNGAIVAPTPEEVRRTKEELRQRHAANAATTHRKYLHAQADIAEVAGAAASVVYGTQAEIDNANRQRMQDFVPTAMDILEDIITGRLPAPIGIRAKYAHLHLGRTGYGVINKVEASSMHQYLTREQIEQLKLRANEAAREAQSESK